MIRQLFAGFTQAAATRARTESGDRTLAFVRAHELAGQVVAGHQQYQNAINAHAHFRRAFAEVFRRRSLLFLGSGGGREHKAGGERAGWKAKQPRTRLRRVTHSPAL